MWEGEDRQSRVPSVEVVAVPILESVVELLREAVWAEVGIDR